MLFLFITCCATAQQARSFFAREDLMKGGTYYYPEQWPQKDWERDLKRIHELGFEFTHYAEFAWSSLEPEEGKYNFGWLDTALQLAEKYQLKVILCTPSAAPPAWLTEKYPETLVVNEDGVRLQHGSRQFASWASIKYREYCSRIVAMLAKRYGHHKNVWGWQIDNEPSHSGGYDYSAAAVHNYRVWLKKKYKNIDSLNSSWGNAFWSQHYNNFEQILIPNQKLSNRVNPHALLDFKRYTADEAAAFIHLQQQVLRKYITPQQWITTNVMPEYGIVDPRRFQQLDLVTYTRYLVPAYGLLDGEQGFRMGGNNTISFSSDFIRSVKGEVAVMELQPGQVNWGKYNPQTYPGAVRMWVYHVFASGNKFVCNYRFRQPLSGIEQYHYGVMQTDGVSLSHSGAEYVQAVNEIKALRSKYVPVATPVAYAARKTAILFNQDNRWETEYQPQTTQWDFMNHVRKYYKAVKSFTAPIDFIYDTTDFTQYPVVIAPAYQLLSRQLIAKWQQYVQQGGQLVLTCRTGQKDTEAHLWEAVFEGPLHQLTGMKEIFFDHLPETMQGGIQAGEQKYSWNNWADVITPADGEIWATYTDQFYAGRAAVITKKWGKGSVTYIGADTDDGKLEKDILKKVYERAGISLAPLPDGVTVEWRDGFWIGMNYSSKEEKIEIPANAVLLTGSNTLPPAGVVVWKDK
jgi:beta-galactosidase